MKISPEVGLILAIAGAGLQSFYWFATSNHLDPSRPKQPLPRRLAVSIFAVLASGTGAAAVYVGRHVMPPSWDSSTVRWAFGAAAFPLLGLCVGLRDYYAHSASASAHVHPGRPMPPDRGTYDRLHFRGAWRRAWASHVE